MISCALSTVASDVMHLSYRMKEKAEELLGLMPVVDEDRNKRSRREYTYMQRGTRCTCREQTAASCCCKTYSLNIYYAANRN